MFHGIVSNVVKGESSCVMCMGPQGSGKTYSLLGKEGDFARMGFVSRLASDLIDQASEDGGPGKVGEALHVAMSSFLIQERAVRDLLSSSVEKRALVEGGGGLAESGMLQVKVTKMSEAMLLVQKAEHASKGLSGHLVFLLSLVRGAQGGRGAAAGERIIGSVAMVRCACCRLLVLSPKGITFEDVLFLMRLLIPGF